MCNAVDILYCIYKNGRWLLVEDDSALGNVILYINFMLLKNMLQVWG